MTRDEFAALSANEAAKLLLPLVRRNDRHREIVRHLRDQSYETPDPSDFQGVRSPRAYLAVMSPYRAAGWFRAIASAHPEPDLVVRHLVHLSDKGVLEVIDAIMRDLDEEMGQR